MRLRFELYEADTLRQIPVPEDRAVNFRNSLGGPNVGYFEPQYGATGDYVRAISEDGTAVAGFFVVKPEDFPKV